MKEIVSSRRTQAWGRRTCDLEHAGGDEARGRIVCGLAEDFGPGNSRCEDLGPGGRGLVVRACVRQAARQSEAGRCAAWGRRTSPAPWIRGRGRVWTPPWSRNRKPGRRGPVPPLGHFCTQMKTCFLDTIPLQFLRACRPLARVDNPLSHNSSTVFHKRP